MIWHRHKLTNSFFATSTKWSITTPIVMVIAYIPSIILVYQYVMALLTLLVHFLAASLLC